VRRSTSEGAGGRGRDGQARLAATKGKGQLFAVAYKSRSTGNRTSFPRIRAPSNLQLSSHRLTLQLDACVRYSTGGCRT
jgi:hypothetical protein